jgi:WD40 repeat protein
VGPRTVAFVFGIAASPSSSSNSCNVTPEVRKTRSESERGFLTLEENFEAVNSMTRVGNTVWTAGDDKCIRVVDFASFTFLKKIRAHMDYIHSLVYSASRVWSASEDRTVGVWDPKVLDSWPFFFFFF